MRGNWFLGLLLIALISLTGCHTMPGNVVPQTGPAMENVYDSMGIHHSKARIVDAVSANVNGANDTQSETDLDGIRDAEIMPVSKPSSLSAYPNKDSSFHVLPNPELKLYVYPHFAGSDQVPIPGYYTAFNAYEKTYYALPTDVMR